MNNTPSPSPESFDLSRFQGWIDHYARMRGIEIIVDDSLPAPMAMPDDIEHLRILVNPKLIHTKMNLSDDEKLVVFFHELEHLFENIELQRTREGRAVYADKMKRIEKSMDQKDADFLRGWGSRFHPATGAMIEQGAMLALENAIRDITVNHEVIDPRKAPALRPVMESLYRMKAFKERDYETLPKHIQFQYAFLREAMLPSEPCSIDPEIRYFIDQLRLFLTDALITEGGLITRLPAIWKHIEPQYRTWYEEDLAKHDEEKRKDEGKQEGKSGGEGQRGESGQGESGESGNGGHEGQGKSGKNEGGKGKPENGESGDQGISTEGQTKGILQKIKKLLQGRGLSQDSSGMKKNPGTSGQTLPPPEGQEGGQEPGESQGENIWKNPFEEYYDAGIPHILLEKGDSMKPNELSEEQIEKILKKLIERQDRERNKTPEERAIENRVKRMGVDTTSADFETKKRALSEYERFKKVLLDQVDADKKNLSDALAEIFARIIARRQKPRYVSRGPVREDQGDGGLDMGAVPGAIADIMGGRGSSDVEMYTQRRVKENVDKFVGRFRLHLVADGSGSMDGPKNQEQKKALLLILESLAKMTEDAQHERKNLSASIEFETSARIFSSSSVHTMKPMGEEFSDKERLDSYAKLDIASGTTGDFVALSQIVTELLGDQDTLEKVRKGEQQEIVIVMTDGGSDDARRLQAEIAILRKQGVSVYGIDMAGDGSSAVANYGSQQDDKLGYGISCPKIADLPGVFVEILSPHLENC